MAIWDFFTKRNRRDAKTAFLVSDESFSDMCASGYTSLDKNPEILAACRKIATLIASTTIHLMNNTENGDERIINELSRKIDIDPMPTMTRNAWMESIVMTMLLYGKGNAVVVPHTHGGYLRSLEPISASRVSFLPVGYRDYKVLIDGKEKNPRNLLHFVYNPDKIYPWKGCGVQIALKDVANNLKQAQKTKNGFMKSKWKPSLIVKVDAMVDEFSSPEGRRKLLDDYVKSSEAGEPWMLPADQFQTEQVKPLSLNDLAINDAVEIDKKTVAAILGVPPFVVGVGEYKKDEWNAFIQSTVMSIAKAVAAEMTKKLILSPSWYLKFNIWSLLDYDIKTVSDVLLQGSDRGFVNGDEWRDRMNLPPAGLDEYRILENYIPFDMSGFQKKLTQNDGGNGDE